MNVKAYVNVAQNTSLIKKITNNQVDEKKKKDKQTSAHCTKRRAQISKVVEKTTH